MGDDYLGEWDVDECREEDGHVGCYEIEDEDFLDHGCFVGWMVEVSGVKLGEKIWIGLTVYSFVVLEIC